MGRKLNQINQLSNVIECLRKEVYKDLPIQHIAILLAVVEQPGDNMRNLMLRLKMPQGSFSRNVKLLSDRYGLLYTTSFMANRKQCSVFPTDKCIQLVEKLSKLMQPEVVEDIHFCRCDTKVA